MKKNYKFTAVITKEDKWFVAECAELKIASQGKTIESSIKNLKEAVALYLKDEEVAEQISKPLVCFLASPERPLYA